MSDRGRWTPGHHHAPPEPPMASKPATRPVPPPPVPYATKPNGMLVPDYAPDSPFVSTQNTPKSPFPSRHQDPMPCIGSFVTRHKLTRSTTCLSSSQPSELGLTALCLVHVLRTSHLSTDLPCIRCVSVHDVWSAGALVYAHDHLLACVSYKISPNIVTHMTMVLRAKDQRPAY